ncbi:MAG TPA: hypothetical protein VD947_04140 [Patescibacteria group bacterium]|nr:hypothetical protein [Patescibacteria group bacterium]
MADPREQGPNQGLSIETLRTLADGSLLTELGEISTQIITSLGASVELARAMQGNNSQAIVEALEHVATGDNADNLSGLESLQQALRVGDGSLDNQALALAGLRSRAPIAGELQGFIDSEKVVAEQRPQRKESLDKCLSIAMPFIEGPSNERTEDYSKKSGRHFAYQSSPYNPDGPDLYSVQYPFITLENGQEVTIKKTYYVDHRYKEIPHSRGFQLLVKTVEDEIPARVYGSKFEGNYWQVYATIKNNTPSIVYSLDAINNDTFRALLADKEMVDKLPEIIAALEEELENPRAIKEDLPERE